MDAFPAYLVRMARIGEMSGNLDNVMTNLADFYARDAELRKKIRSALVYPSVLLLMMLGIIVLLVARVLPVFSQILASFGGSMPAFSQGAAFLRPFCRPPGILAAAAADRPDHRPGALAAAQQPPAAV